MHIQVRGWFMAYWILLVCFLLTAILNMLRISAGFASNHLADLVVPAWLYIAFRGLAGKGKATLVQRIIGVSRERTAAVLILGSAVTELSQRFWPHGLFPGRFDPWDLLAYVFGVSLCYVADKYFTQDAMKPASELC